MSGVHVVGARIYCARGANKWGLGFSKYQALDACGASDGDEFVVEMLPPNACRPVVDTMGTLHWFEDDGDAERVGKFVAVYYDKEEDLTDGVDFEEAD